MSKQPKERSLEVRYGTCGHRLGFDNDGPLCSPCDNTRVRKEMEEIRRRHSVEVTAPVRRGPGRPKGSGSMPQPKVGAPVVGSCTPAPGIRQGGFLPRDRVSPTLREQMEANPPDRKVGPFCPVEKFIEIEGVRMTPEIVPGRKGYAPSLWVRLLEAFMKSSEESMRVASKRSAPYMREKFRLVIGARSDVKAITRGEACYLVKIGA